MGTPTVPGLGFARKKKKKKKKLKESVPVPGTVAAHQRKKNSERVNGKEEEKEVKESMVDQIMGGRRRIRETEEDSVLDKEEIIPDDAEPALGAGNTPPEMMTSEEDDGDDVQEPLMDPSVALIAPDVTPGAFQPISVDKVEQSKNIPPKPTATPAPTLPGIQPAPQAQPAPAQPEPGRSDTLKTIMGQMGAGQPMPESQEQPPAFTASKAGMTGDALLGQGEAMPAPVEGQPNRIWESFGHLHSSAIRKA